MNVEEWPEGASHKINGVYTKWVDEVEYDFSDGVWHEATMGWSLSYYLRLPHFNIVERPIKTEREELIDIIKCVCADYEEVADTILAAGFTNKP